MILAFVDVEFEKLCDVKTQLKTSTEYIPDLIVSFEKVLSIEGTLIEEAAEELLTKTIRAKVMKNMQNTKKVLKSMMLELPIYRSKLNDCKVTETLQLRVSEFKQLKKAFKNAEKKLVQLREFIAQQLSDVKCKPELQ